MSTRDSRRRGILKTHATPSRHPKTVTWADCPIIRDPPRRYRTKRMHVHQVSDDRMAYTPVNERDRPKSHRTPRYDCHFETILQNIPPYVQQHPRIMKRIAVMQRIDERIRHKMDLYNGITQASLVYMEGKRQGRFYYTPSLNKHYL